MKYRRYTQYFPYQWSSIVIAFLKTQHERVRIVFHLHRPKCFPQVVAFSSPNFSFVEVTYSSDYTALLKTRRQSLRLWAHRLGQEAESTKCYVFYECRKCI